MEQDFNLHVKLDTGDAVQGLTNIKTAADQAATSVGKIGENAQSAAQEVSKVGEAASESIPKVQGLGSAFEGAFSTAVQMGSQAGGTLGDIFKSVNQAIPAVKKINNTAITGLKGVKAALLSTGIGAFIVAIGVLTSHWEGFLHAVGSSKEEFDEFKKKALDTLGNIVSGVVGVGNVILQNLLVPIRTVITSVQGLGKVMKDVFTGQWGKIKEDAQNALGAIKDVYEKGFDFSGNFQKGKEAGEKFVKGVVTTFTYKAPEVEKEAVDALSGGSSSGKGNAYRKAGEKAGKQFGKGVEEGFKEEYREMSSEVKKILEALVQEKEFKNVKEHLQDLFTFDEQQLEFLFDPDFGDKIQDQFTEIYIEFKQNKDKLEKELEQVKIDLGNPFLDEDTAEEYKQRYDELIQGIIDLSLKLEQDTGKVWHNAAFEAEERDLEVLRRRSEANREFGLEQVSLWTSSELTKAKAIKEINEQSLREQEMNLQARLDLLEREGKKETEEYIKIQDQLKELQLTKLLTSEEDTQRIKQALAEQVSAYADAAASIASIFGTVAQAEEERIQRQLENGQITEAEAKRQFETVKNWQLAENWINTAAGITRALTSIETSKGIPGWVAQAAQAAALLANGIAQDRRIRSTQFGGGASGGGGGTSAPNVGVTPIEVTDDIQQSPSVLAASQSPRDQRVYILEGDIQESDRRVEIREENSTF